MKTIRTIVLMSLAIVMICCKEDDHLESTLLIGDWQSEEIYVNGKLQDAWINNSTILSIRVDQTYYKNYTSGSWLMQEDNITLIPRADLSIKSHQYKVIEASNDLLMLETTLTEGDYGRDFDQVETDEQITVREKFRRKN
ncbi:hypothetical protein MKJ04_06765 [Pontibacter sp. E15-1]|uniref:hypothetical protein n=1 Tax=Pontibacter sp. E15-1 TaxID=2919918 RepID=UPI001F4F4702|nr:hypothetical protein [Pontibacter sp. E15-1]MCJ8164543.1 hypothetical protein [Pontibacter sp. E15-1]